MSQQKLGRRNMSTFVRAHLSWRIILPLLLSVALAIAASGNAAAKPRPKKLKETSEPAASISMPAQRAGAPVRFFTINEVLAKRDARGGSPDQPVRLAAVDPKDTATDAP